MASRRAFAAVLALAAGAGAGCAPSGPGQGPDAGPTADRGSALSVVTGFYPLQYAAEQVGGDRVDVVNLTRPGTDPHDVELAPRDVARVADADLAVYEKLLQPAVDAAITRQPPAHVLEVGQDADLSLTTDDQPDGRAVEGARAAPGPPDPHFWLDPTRYDAVVRRIGAQLAAIDPAGAAQYEANAQRLSATLRSLDGEYRAGLRQCASRNLVTSHAAFGYLADRYGLVQIAIAGPSGDLEPEPARLARIADFVTANKVDTIYTETLGSSAVAKTVAAETGATTATLDTIEGLTDASPGADYPAIMRANLATLRTGQGCS